MARKRQVRKHTVDFDVTQTLQLAKEGSAITFRVRDEGEILGTIQVGRGSLVWWGRKDKNGYRIPWSRFAAIMERVREGRR